MSHFGETVSGPLLCDMWWVKLWTVHIIQTFNAVNR